MTDFHSTQSSFPVPRPAPPPSFPSSPMSEAHPVSRLKPAIDYAYRLTQKRELQARARTRQEHEDASMTLRLLGLLCDGWSSGPRLFDVACGHAMGSPKGGQRSGLLRSLGLILRPGFRALGRSDVEGPSKPVCPDVLRILLQDSASPLKARNKLAPHFRRWRWQLAKRPVGARR